MAATTFNIPISTNQSIELQSINLDGVLFDIRLDYIYDQEVGNEYYIEELDCWTVILKKDGKELYRTKAVLNYDFLKYIGIEKPEGILYFRCTQARINSAVRKNDFVNKLVFLDYVTTAELQENNTNR